MRIKLYLELLLPLNADVFRLWIFSDHFTKEPIYHFLYNGVNSHFLGSNYNHVDFGRLNIRSIPAKMKTEISGEGGSWKKSSTWREICAQVTISSQHVFFHFDCHRKDRRNNDIIKLVRRVTEFCLKVKSRILHSKVGNITQFFSSFKLTVNFFYFLFDLYI